MAREVMAAALTSSIRYALLSLTVAAVQGTLYVSLVAQQVARLESAGSAHYRRGALDEVLEVLGPPVFLGAPPQWTFWLRPRLGEDISGIGIFVLINALSWGVGVATVVWWWRRKMRRRRLLLIGLAGVGGLATVLLLTGFFTAMETSPVSYTATLS